jgi:hypothetical protein
VQTLTIDIEQERVCALEVVEESDPNESHSLSDQPVRVSEHGSAIT